MRRGTFLSARSLRHFPERRLYLCPPTPRLPRGQPHLGPPISHYHSGHPDLGRHMAAPLLREMLPGSTHRPFPSWSPLLGGPGDGFHVFRPLQAGITCSWCRWVVWVVSEALPRRLQKEPPFPRQTFGTRGAMTGGRDRLRGRPRGRGLGRARSLRPRPRPRPSG